MLCAINLAGSFWTRYFDISKDWLNKPVEIIETVEADQEVMVIDKPIQFIIESGGSRVSGALLEFDNKNEAILIPYKYKIMDDKCLKTLRIGYFDQWSIQGTNRYILEFKPVVAKDNKLCMVMEPFEVNMDSYDKYLKIKTVEGQIKLDWLYY